jgi:hypothetical protein
VDPASWIPNSFRCHFISRAPQFVLFAKYYQHYQLRMRWAGHVERMGETKRCRIRHEQSVPERAQARWPVRTRPTEDPKRLACSLPPSGLEPRHSLQQARRVAAAGTNCKAPVLAAWTPCNGLTSGSMSSLPRTADCRPMYTGTRNFVLASDQSTRRNKQKRELLGYGWCCSVN